MIRKIIILLTLISVSVTTLFGQSDVKRINTIKRDSTYVWQEATADSEESAYDATETGLMMLVIEYVAKKSESGQVVYSVSEAGLLADVLLCVNAKDVRTRKDATEKLKKTIGNHVSRISVPRGDMTRVFLYLPVSYLVPASVAVKPVTKPEVNLQENPEVIPEPVVTPKPEKEVPSQPLAPTVSDPVVSPVNKDDNKKGSSEVEIDVLDPFTQNPDSLIPEISKPWQREVVNKLLSANDINDLKAMLPRMKADHKIKKYGPMSQCPDRDNSYLVIFEDAGRIRALLGPQQREGRADYLTRTYKSLSDYSGMNAIWFIFEK